MTIKESEFGRFHPIVQFIYFSSVIFWAMFIREPVFLGISLISSVLYALYLGGKQTFKVLWMFVLPMFLLVAAINPLFNHRGVTILAYLPDGNPFTMESLVYGCVSGMLFSSTMLWCVCLKYIMSSDKIVYLFGRIAPKLGLLISMILRFVPKLSAHFREVRYAQRAIGRDITDGTFKTRIVNSVRIFSSTLQWVMENSIDTANSLESRGYGLPHRTSFSLFRFEKRDGGILVAVMIGNIGMIAGYGSGILEFDYFPMISEITNNFLLAAGYAALCTLPLAIDLMEDGKWKYIKWKI